MGKGGDTRSCGISPREVEDCLEALSGHVAARIVGCLFLEIVESVIEERERVIEERERL